MTSVTLETVYRLAYGGPVAPYPFQRAVAERPNADILIAPTGLGKTAAVTLGWVWRRLTTPGTTPRRLVWCLPMRTLVEQTATQARGWIRNLGDLFAGNNLAPTVHVLMGGTVDDDWRLRPEAPAIIVGTQDMLLSRALMRGYGMGRFGWPIDYGLLHSDALWVFDEVQLMGAGLATSAQLEAFRRRRSWHRDGLAHSLWVSATLDPDWLRTAEFRSEVLEPVLLRWDDGKPPEPPDLAARLDAVKRLRRAGTSVTADNVAKPAAYATALAREVAAAHRSDSTTLVIVNTVRRAQALYAALADVLDAATERLLLHSRYRPPDRQVLLKRLTEGAAADRIVVATQAVEAGVDMTSAVLFTELAPWSSLVQRFGRCNRAGECNAVGGAAIHWIDLETTKDGATARPYAPDELSAARDVLLRLEEASPRNLPPPSRPVMPNQVIRPKDFEELFDTDADLSGYDLDVSPYIRDGDDMTVSLFWRAIGDGAEMCIADDSPSRDELCAAPLGKEITDWLTPKSRIVPVYVEDPLAPGDRGWIRLDRSGRRLRPGLVLLLDVGLGGYDPALGFVGAGAKTPVVPIRKEVPVSARDADAEPGSTTGADHLSFGQAQPISVEQHLDDVAHAVREIAEAVHLPSGETAAVVRACAWHDLGKAYAPFQTLLGHMPGGSLLAKSAERSAPPARRKQAKEQGLRNYFRHELASALAFLHQHDGEPDADLVAFLIAAHHGKVRLGLRALPDERPTDPTRRIARGVQDGDALPGLRCGDEISQPVALDLALMEMGEDAHGRPSWSARTQALLAQYGPFRLAYLEALVRMADWRVSAIGQQGAARDE